MHHLMTAAISVNDWIRIVLVYSHLLFCAFALSTVLTTDIRIALGLASRRDIAVAAKWTTALLTALWVTGLLLIYNDTAFNPAVIATQSKLLLKLVCVSILTLNGIVLHRVAFPILERQSEPVSARETVLLTMTGALSTSHWMLAAFVGMAKPIARLPFETLMLGYGMFVCSVLVTSLFFIPQIGRATRALHS